MFRDVPLVFQTGFVCCDPNLQHSAAVLAERGSKTERDLHVTLHKVQNNLSLFTLAK